MNYQAANDWRSRRNLLNHSQVGTMSPFGHMHYSTSNYSTDASKKAVMQEQFGDDILISKLHMIPNPLQKNLADTILSSPDINVKMATKTKESCNQNNMAAKVGNTNNDYQSTFSGITSFITGVFNVISGSFFHRQTKSEMECFDKDFDVCPQTFNAWQTSNFEDLNKNGLGDDQFRSSNIDINNINQSEMINDCRTAAEQCEDKLDKVRLLLSSKAVPIPPKQKPHRPRKVFVDPSSVEDNFEDAFCPEDFKNLSNETYVECISPYNIQNQVLQEIDAPKLKTEVPPVQKNMEVVNSNLGLKEKMEIVSENVNNATGVKQEVVLSCEDKLSKLKALLQEKKKKCTSTISESPVENISDNKSQNDRPVKSNKSVPTSKVKDKRFKNPHKMKTSKKSHLRRNMLDDMCFANEIDCDISSTDNSPTIILNSMDMLKNGHLHNEKDYFDEISGRFHSSSLTESDDSFQIVFTDSPKCCRPRKISDCDSEDSFIVFEGSPGCYTSTDVFGSESSDDDSNCSDSDSEFSDSGCDDMSCKLSHTFSRTVGDLTDDSLYEEGSRFGQCDSADEIDSSPKQMCQEIPLNAVSLVGDILNPKESNVNTNPSKGLLMDETKKLQKRNQPPKKVQFSSQPPKVHVMRVWAFAARQARAGHWERHALDRERFKRRIADVEMAVSWVLKPQHRSRIMFQRFMPWWNAQKRKELEEIKKKKEEERNLEKDDRPGEVTNVEIDNKEVDKINIDNFNNVENTVMVDNNNVVHKSFGNDFEVQNFNEIESNKSVNKDILPTNLNEINIEKNKDATSAQKDVITVKNVNTCLLATVSGINKTDIENCSENNVGCSVNGFLGVSRDEDQIYSEVDDNRIEIRNKMIDENDIDNFKGEITKNMNMCNDLIKVDPNVDNISKI